MKNTKIAQKGNFTLFVKDSEVIFNPRTEYDCFSNMVCFHNRYRLGDKHNYNKNDYNSWEELKNAITKDNDIFLIYPLYMYEHSGVSLSIEPFSCPFDSGQIGFVFVTKQMIRESFSIKRCTKKYETKALDNIKSELSEYVSYLNGESYEYVIEDENNDVVDSCCGYFSYDDCVAAGSECLNNM